MKFVSITLLSILASASAFAPSHQGVSTSITQSLLSTTSLSMSLNSNNDAQSRRAALVNLGTAAGIVTSTSTLFPSSAFALGGSSAPKYENMKQIYSLGMSLDSLKAKVADPDQSEAALVGIRAFNRDPNFYTGYARNFISKTVKNNADGDVRVGYIRQASSVIGSIQELLEGRQGLYGADASKEAVARVEKAQALIGKFLAECGIEDEKFGPYIAAHPY